MVDFLKQAKNLISGKDPNEPAPIYPDNRIDRVDQAKVIWYQWTNELATSPGAIFTPPSLGALSGDDSKLAASRSYDISNHIETISFTKSMDTGAGSFQMTLQNSFDWARFMRPGQWVVIMMTGDGDLPLPQEVASTGEELPTLGELGKSLAGTLAGKILNVGASFNPTVPLPLPPGPDVQTFQSYKPKIRCLGIIQRVGIRSSTNPDGVAELVFTVTGKDYGTVYEESELWFNANNADGAAFSAALDSIVQQFSRNLTDLLDKWHDIFINPSGTLAQSITNINSFFPRQWILPNKLVRDMGFSMKQGGLYFGDISDLKEFNATVFESADPNLLAGLQGRCWDRLKGCSEPGYHELFTEISDSGNPKIIFRPIPWAIDKSTYPTLGKVMLNYADLASPDGALPPAPVGTIVSTLSSLAGLDALSKQVGGGGDDIRDFHRIDLNATEVESYDIGPDYHSRANFFLVDAMRSTLDQKNAFAILSKSISNVPFPYRDENDIKRHGFKPRFLQLQTFNISSKSNLFASQPYGNHPSSAFMIEANGIMRDFYANAEDFYSGTMSIAAAKNEIKLGKVIVTDESFQGIGNMIFYVEAYTDSFTVNMDKVTSWTQTVTVTRGIHQQVLDGGSTKDIPGTKASTFHVDNSDAAQKDGSVLGKVKSAIKNPRSLF